MILATTLTEPVRGNVTRPVGTGNGAYQVVNLRNSPNEMIRVGTWTVRTIWREEKQVKINRHGLQILSLTEARLKDNVRRLY